MVTHAHVGHFYGDTWTRRTLFMGKRRHARHFYADTGDSVSLFGGCEKNMFSFAKKVRGWISVRRGPKTRGSPKQWGSYEEKPDQLSTSEPGRTPIQTDHFKKTSQNHERPD